MRAYIKTYRFLPFFVLLVFSDAVLYEAYAGENDIRWHTYTDGMNAAGERNLPVFLHFYADWCRYCAKMEKETFQDFKVIQYVNDNYVAIKVDFDTERKLALKYQIRALPATFVIGSDGSQTGPMQGFISKEVLLQVLKQNQ